MHMNHFPTHLQEPLPWFHKPANQYSVDFEDRLSVNETSQHHHHTAEAAAAAAAQIPMYDKEPMFEKPLTPSDVGKLNRLVIPKQHAERYFPLGAGDAAGTLLGFEDEAGKSWRFRYSYWNSSQSYVLTKGWSRYVKDKRLDAGDVVFFERHRSDREKLFIGWRRRGAPTSMAVCYNEQGYHVAQDSRRQIPPLNYQPDCPPCHQGGGPGKEEQEVTRVHSPSNNNNPTRLVRLFGVNFECQQDDSSSRTTSSEGSSSSIQQQQQQQQQQAYHNYFNYMGYPRAPSYHNHHQHQMDMEFEQGMKQMGNRLG